MAIAGRWIISLFVCGLCAWPAWGHRVVILKSEELKIYSETIAAFKADLKDHTIEEILIAEKT